MISDRVSPGFFSELAPFGGGTVTRCFNCGNCTAICELSGGESAFPQRVIRMIQLGQPERLLASAEPWLCYYCGRCSETCPRDAQPGEVMMAVRRWLTSRYDLTGLSRRLYTSMAWELGLLAFVALFVVALFTIPSGFGFRLLAQHPEAQATVMLQHFAPKAVVHRGDLILAAFLALFLLINSARMLSFVMAGEKVPLGAYLSRLKELVIHLLTQKSWRKCEGEARKPWIRHLLLVTGYGTMFVLVIFFLPWFQVESGGARAASWHWSALFGYYGSLILLGATSWMMVDRFRKRAPLDHFSHSTDWLFLVLLFLTALTGVALHVFRLGDWPMATYVTYVVHLAIAVPMLVVEVPFGKWAHLAYRPLAQYAEAVKARAREVRAAAPVLVAPLES